MNDAMALGYAGANMTAPPQAPAAHRPRLSPAMGAGAVGARSAVSGGHGEAQRERRRDPAALRRHARPSTRSSPISKNASARPGSSATCAHSSISPPNSAGWNGYERRRTERPRTRIGPPLWLLAELTYRCPLHCVFCYNPVDFAKQEDELSTADWLRVLREARAIGAVQCGFSGGEPLQRNDLEILVAEAHKLGYYTNLITSGIGLNEQRIEWLKEAGLDHIQLSFQDSTREVNDFLSSTRTFDLKRKAAAADQAIRLFDGHELRDPSAQHRSHRSHHRACGRARCRLPRACQHAVLFVGAHQPRSAAADARAARARRGDHESLAREARLEDETLLRRAGLLRDAPEEMHERLGQRVHDDRARRRRAALPHRAHAAGPGVSERARAQRRATSGTNPKASTAIAAPAG